MLALVTITYFYGNLVVIKNVTSALTLTAKNVEFSMRVFVWNVPQLTL